MKLANYAGRATLVLEAGLDERVQTIKLGGPPVRKRNNLIRSFGSVPETVTPMKTGFLRNPVPTRAGTSSSRFDQAWRVPGP